MSCDFGCSYFCGFVDWVRCIFREMGAKRKPPFSVSSSDTPISTWEATRSYVSEHLIKNSHRCSKLDQYVTEEDAMKLHEKKLTSCNIILYSVRQHNHFITQGNYKATCFDYRLIILRSILSIVSHNDMHTLGTPNCA